jgi:uncharacterized membrane protein
MKKVFTYFFAIFMMVAGLNHFLNPDFYLPLIPPYLPWPEAVNMLSGVLELAAGAGLLLAGTRRVAALGIAAMMLAFVPAHVYFVQIGSCIPDGLCVPAWLGWLRLLLIQPLLLAAALWIAGPTDPKSTA